MRLRYAVLMLLTLNVPAVLAGESAKPKLTYQQDFAKWKGELEDDLKKNWLTVVGLFWLKEGANRVGGDPSDDVPLPKDKVPAQVGEIDFHNNAVSFKATAGASVKSGGKLVQSTALQPDVSGKPTKLEVGDVYFYVIQRGNRFGVRVKDVHSKQLAAFKGTKFYPAQPKYIVTGTFVPFDKPQKVSVPTQIGQDAEMDSPGVVEFTLNGQKLRLQALSEGDQELFFIFKDQTSGKTTYPPGRFLYSDPPKDGKVVIDFNRAYSPPCAWTPYATCPLPPKQNVLKVAVEAGEKFAGHPE